MTPGAIQFYPPAAPMRVLAVQMHPDGEQVTEVPVLSCYHEQDEYGESTGFMVFDDRDRCPVRLCSSCWHEVRAQLIVGPASLPEDWWRGRIDEAVGYLRACRDVPRSYADAQVSRTDG